MRLSEVGRKRAVHASGRYFIDQDSAKRRYWVIAEIDHEDDPYDADNLTSHAYASKPEGFPEDGWILLEP